MASYVGGLLSTIQLSKKKNQKPKPPKNLPGIAAQSCRNSSEYLLFNKYFQPIKNNFIKATPQNTKCITAKQPEGEPVSGNKNECLMLARWKLSSAWVKALPREQG